MKAEIMSIGTELLMGELTDTNASFIASRLPPLGIQLQWVSQVGDNLDMLAEAFTRGTQPLRHHLHHRVGWAPLRTTSPAKPSPRPWGRRWWSRRICWSTSGNTSKDVGTDMPATNIKQATLIRSAQSIPNRRGTAPGWWVEKVISPRTSNRSSGETGSSRDHARCSG